MSRPRLKPISLDNWTHGRHGTYNAGCRCDECKAAQVTKVLAERRSRRAKLDLYPDLPIDHGKYTTYNNWGCRCDLCIEAYRVHRSGQRARKRQQS